MVEAAPTGRQVSRSAPPRKSPPPATPPTPPAPPAAKTKEAILAAALDLFTEQGFEKTSLREVAERVGVSKAALYYHFKSKEEILAMLVERLHFVGNHGLDVLPKGKGPVDGEAVFQAIQVLMDGFLANHRVFRMMERNPTAVQGLRQQDPEHAREHEQMERYWNAFSSDPDIPLRDRVRVLAAMGAVLGGAIGTMKTLEDADLDPVRSETLAVVREILRLGS